MAHAIEKMMFVGETPWHGLGTAFDEDAQLTTAEALEHGGLDHEYELVGIKTADNQDIDIAKAVRRKTDKKIYTTVGLQYRLLQPKDSLEFFDPFIESGYARYHTAGSLAEGAKIWILAELNRRPIEVVKGDEVKKFILLSNSFDGTTSVRVGTTPVRVVCANTLALAHKDKASNLFLVRHTKTMQIKLDALRDVVDQIDASFELAAEKYRFLVKKSIDDAKMEKYARKVFDIKGDKLNGQQKRMLEQVTKLFHEGKGNTLSGVEGTYWSAYNSVTEWLSYQRGQGQDTRLTSLWFGASHRDNNHALTVALQMAT